MSKFKPIIDKLFDSNKSFKKEDFLEFISDLTGRYPDDIKKSISKDENGNQYSKEEIEVYEDETGEKIAIMTYKMPTSSKVEKARSHQRNLISTYLKNTGVYNDVDSVLVAFYSENNPDWRLSFIKQEFKYDKETKKILNELTPAKRYSFLVDSNSKNITVKQRLTELLKGNKCISNIEEAFSVEKVSKEFFDKYKDLYKKLTSAFEKDRIFQKIESESNHGDNHFKENFVKKLLGQIVFLYFLQKKGWLGVKKDGKWGEGNKRFMQDLLKECLEGGDSKKELGGKHFFNDYLEHLFYDFLNKNEKDRKEPDYFKCKIPYLNGGLFEPMNGYEWTGLENILLTGKENNLLFKEIFDTFDEYNFTVYENDPLEQDVAVDPEMLGKVFENLLPENERKGKGAFYTPREIVHYMCKESLKNHIINKTGISEEKINGLFERKDSMYNLKEFGKKLSEEERYKQFGEYIEYAENIVKSLKTIKIVDPAVGSGAFPMGLLKEIVSLRKYLQENILLEDNVSEYKIKKETLENCIYGVDLDPGAVEIAKLRFWLSLVIEEESGDKIDPLPNLDYKIMQGNSLIEDIVVGDRVIKLDIEINSKKITKKAEADFKREEKKFNKATQGTMSLFADESIRDDTLKRLKFLHKIFFQEKDNNKKKILKKEIDHIEKELIRLSGEVEVNKLQEQIENIQGKYILSGMAWDEKDAKKVATWQGAIASIKEMEEKYARDNIRSFFPWKLHFGEVFNDNGGFDIVIGNPPYVQLQKNGGELANMFEKCGYESFVRSGDIYCLFYELGNNLLKNTGHLIFITSNKWMRAGYGEKIRNFLAYNTTPKILIDLGSGVFETATVDTNILLFKKSKSENICLACDIKKNLVKESIKLNDYIENNKVELNNFSSDSWIILNQVEQGIKKKIEKIGVPLKDWDIKINYGIKTGYNDAFIIDSKKKDELILADPKNLEIIKPILRGKDIKKYRSEFSDLWLIETLPAKKLDINDFPTIKEYLSSFGKKLEQIGGKYIDENGVSQKTRKKNGNAWFETQDQINYYEEFEKEKIIYPNMASIFTAFFDKDCFLTNQKCFIITGNSLLFLTAFLNSKLNNYYFRQIGAKLGNKGLEMSKIFVEKIPVPNLSQEKQKPFINLVEQILEITKKEDYLEREDFNKQVEVLESKIDNMIYELYGLSKEEIELVKESLR